jgi:hypothetical protein
MVVTVFHQWFGVSFQAAYHSSNKRLTCAAGHGSVQSKTQKTFVQSFKGALSITSLAPPRGKTGRFKCTFRTECGCDLVRLVRPGTCTTNANKRLGKAGVQKGRACGKVKSNVLPWRANT